MGVMVYSLLWVNPSISRHLHQCRNFYWSKCNFTFVSSSTSKQKRRAFKGRNPKPSREVSRGSLKGNLQGGLKGTWRGLGNSIPGSSNSVFECTCKSNLKETESDVTEPNLPDHLKWPGIRMIRMVRGCIPWPFGEEGVPPQLRPTWTLHRDTNPPDPPPREPNTPLTAKYMGLHILSEAIFGWLSKLWSLFGSLLQYSTYYLGCPKRDHNLTTTHSLNKEY